MLLLVLAALDTYVVRALKREFLDAAFSQLESLIRLALVNPPQSPNEPDLKEWTKRFGQSGARVTLIANNGKVLADSVEDPAKMENHLPRPEIREALLRVPGARCVAARRLSMTSFTSHSAMSLRMRSLWL